MSGKKIIEGLREALAFARGEKSEVRVFYPKPPVVFDPAEEEGWIRADFRPPIGKGPVEWMRREWVGPQFLAWEDMPAEANVYGLYWRLP